MHSIIAVEDKFEKCEMKRNLKVNLEPKKITVEKLGLEKDFVAAHAAGAAA